MSIVFFLFAVVFYAFVVMFYLSAVVLSLSVVVFSLFVVVFHLFVDVCCLFVFVFSSICFSVLFISDCAFSFFLLLLFFFLQLSFNFVIVIGTSGPSQLIQDKHLINKPLKHSWQVRLLWRCKWVSSLLMCKIWLVVMTYQTAFYSLITHSI